MANQKVICQAQKTVAPVFQKRDESRWDQDKGDYYDHLVGGYQGGGKVKGWSKDNLSPKELEEVYSHYREKGYANICSSAQTEKQVGVRGFIFEESEWQDCPEEILNNISRTRGCMEPGEYRVTKSDADGVRDIIFMKEDTSEDYEKNYEEKARMVLKKNYLYGGKFRIIDKKNKKMCEIKMKIKDEIFGSPKNKGKDDDDETPNIGKLVLVLEDYTELYDVYYCVEEKEG